jgi:hypothetical protein
MNDQGTKDLQSQGWLLELAKQLGNVSSLHKISLRSRTGN